MEMLRTLTERELMVEHGGCVCAATHTFLYKIEVYTMSISINKFNVNPKRKPINRNKKRANIAIAVFQFGSSRP